MIIGGFDKSHHFPSFAVFNIYFNNNGKIIYEDIESKINCEEPIIRVYAINEEAYSFITGVNGDFEKYIKSYIKDSNEKIIDNMKWYFENENIEENDKNKILFTLKIELNSYYNDLSSFIEKYKLDALEYTSEVSEIIPRQFLCDFAENLVKLTAIKQKLSVDLETVSSETDMALITKSNNFKWVKFVDEII